MTDDVCEDDAPSPIPSDQNDEDYQPGSVVMVKLELERRLKTRKDDATEWEAISEN